MRQPRAGVHWPGLSGGRGLLWLFPVVAALALVRPPTVQADGGLPVVLKLIKPYEITVYASSPRLANMTVDVSLLLVKDPLGEFVPDAQIMLRATPVGHASPVYTFPATHALATQKIFYAANVRLPAGNWQFVANLQDGDWKAQIPFQLAVTQPAKDSHFPFGVVAVWVAAALVLGGAVLIAVRARRHSLPRSRPGG